jgi:serine/threonine-protein kinase
MQHGELASWNLQHGDEIVTGLTAIKLLGGGAAYEAYLCFDDTLYAPVVVKVVRPDQVGDAVTLRGLERECDMLATLNHPVIVRGFRADLGGDRPHLVLESLDGPRLSSLLRQHGPLPLQQLLPLGLELASAVHYLGRRGVVHLDIKPSNIIMGAPARLIDLSVARSVEAAAELSRPIGTDLYMAPEQCLAGRGRRPGPAADMWGIGATLFHALAGYQPFERGAGGPDAAPEDRWPQLVDEPHLLPPTVPDDVAKPVLGCLEADPDARPTPAELAEAFEPAMAALPKARLSGFKVSLR